MLLVFLGSLAGLGLVVSAVQILWINLVADGILAVTLGLDPKADDLMDRPPRSSDEGILSRPMLASIGAIGVLMALVTLPLFYANRADPVTGRTIVFTALVLVDVVRLRAVRPELGPTSNRWLLFAIVATVSAQAILLYTANVLFETVALAGEHWIQILATVGVFVAGMEGYLFLRSRNSFG